VRYLSAHGVTVRALYYRHAPTGELKALPNTEWIHCDLLDVFGVEEVMQGITDIYIVRPLFHLIQQADEMLHFNTKAPQIL